MAGSTSQLQDGTDHNDAAHACQSLVGALRAIARDAGFDLDRDDVNAALGMCWSPVAIPAEADIGRWPMYARDAFLGPVGQLFGLTMRDIHPPEASRGLAGSTEFAQHFDASYRPLICRALEHDQPVLAWQGWPGECELAWGIIRNVCDDGVGFAGETFGHGVSAGSRQSVALVRPPVQLYVVEEIAFKLPEPNELFELVLRSMQIVMSNGLAERAGIVTGPAAYDLWIERVTAAKDQGRAAVEITDAHVRLAAATRAGYECGIRFLERHGADASPSRLEILATVIDALRSAVTKLRTAEDLGVVSNGDRTAIQALAGAREATRAIALGS